MELQHFSVQTSRLNLAGLQNSASQGRPVIALHGWLDNAASFLPMARLTSTDRPFFALELPGHGLSEHRPEACTYHMAENIVDVLAFVAEISTDQAVDLVGHSLGGIIGALVAAAAPERVNKLVLLDSLGPYTDETSQVLPQLRKAVKKASSLSPSKLVVYPDKEKAARVRMSGVGKITMASAVLLVERGLKPIEGGFIWTSDPKLMEPSMMRFSEEQVRALFNGIECPVQLICGDKGYFSDYKALEKRLSYIKNIEKHLVEGGHHFHMEGDVAKMVALISEFLGL